MPPLDSIIQDAKNIDLLAYANRFTTLKRVAASGGGEYAGPCPMCKGTDRFRVQPNQARWLCRNCTEGKWRDSIALHMALTGQAFVQAVQDLAGQNLPPAPAARLAPPAGAPAGEPPNTVWQHRAMKTIEQAEAALWATEGAQALAWLRKRGLTDATIRHARLGFIPNERHEPGTDWGNPGASDKAIWLPKSVLIPCLVGGAVWYLKMRRPVGEPKYVQVRGSQPAMYGADTLTGRKVVIFVEGEIDALTVWQAVQDLAGVATLGGNTQPLAVMPWGLYLLNTPQRWVGYDADLAGRKGAARLAWLGGYRVIEPPIMAPDEKDWNDCHRAGANLRGYIMRCFERERASGQAGPARPLPQSPTNVPQSPPGSLLDVALSLPGATLQPA